jgi:hypothetical protein
MSEINTTSINDLPTDPANGGTIGGNISLVTNEGNNIIPPMVPSNQAGGQLSLDQTTISQIVNGLQQASLAGATQLPSRDIPTHTEQLTHDLQVQPNYVPEPKNNDYILENEDDINNYYNQEKVDNSLDSIYDEIQAPLLLAVLYFLFQLPFFKSQYLDICHFFVIVMVIII